MIPSTYANENELVNDFIQYTFAHPLLLNGEEVRHLFIWGTEIWLPDGRSNTKSGILDLIGTDETGEVWLIEAKLGSNPELENAIWKKQLEPYRISLTKRSEEQIILGAKPFLLGDAKGRQKPPFIHTGINSLVEAFFQWGEFRGFTSSKSKELYDKTIEKLKSGEIITAVLADVTDKNVWLNRYKFSQNKGFSYISFDHGQILVIYENNWMKTDKFYENHAKGITWEDAIKKKAEIKPAPDTVGLYLTDEAARYYQYILERLVGMGWNQKFQSNKKAFQFDLPTKYGADIRIHLGWVDADGSIDIKYRTLHNFGLKFNIDFRHFKQRPELKEVCLELTKKLADTAHYSGRGAATNLLTENLTDEQYASWDGEMYRRVNRWERDYIGKESERLDLEAALKFLEEIVLDYRSFNFWD